VLFLFTNTVEKGSLHTMLQDSLNGASCIKSQGVINHTKGILGHCKFRNLN